MDTLLSRLLGVTAAFIIAAAAGSEEPVDALAIEPDLRAAIDATRLTDPELADALELEVSLTTDQACVVSDTCDPRPLPE